MTYPRRDVAAKSCFYISCKSIMHSIGIYNAAHNKAALRVKQLQAGSILRWVTDLTYRGYLTRPRLPTIPLSVRNGISPTVHLPQICFSGMKIYHSVIPNPR